MTFAEQVRAAATRRDAKRGRPCKNCGPVSYTAAERAVAAARKAAAASRPDAPPCPKRPKTLQVCPRYKLIVSKAICERCKVDPEFKQSLFAMYIRNRAARTARCRHGGEPVGTKMVTCCGGAKKAEISLRDCKLHNRVSDPDCWVCGDYKPKGR